VTEDEEKCAFYAAIGQAITEWSQVENHLFTVLEMSLKPANHMLSAAAFYAVDNFRAKLGMVDAVVQLALVGSPQLPKWDVIMRALSKKSKKRNDLAHHQVLFNRTKKEGKRYLLRPAVMDPHAPSVFAENQGLYLNELKWRIAVFKVLAQRIRQFRMDTWPPVPLE
jgi:hypothetical protein